MIATIDGDLLSGDYQYIAHQCYATSYNKAAGLAKTIFNKWPYANCYNNTYKTLGTIQVAYGVQNVINMFAQFYPGKPRANDDVIRRLSAFRACLNKISQLQDIKQVAFPYKIGCGLAGGNWADYERLLCKFAEEASFEVLIINPHHFR